MATQSAEKREQGFALVEIIIIAVVVVGLGVVVTLRYMDAENQQNAAQRQASEQATADSLKLSASEKAAKIAEDKKKAEEAAKQTQSQAQSTPTQSTPPAPSPSVPSSTRYNSPQDLFEQLDPETAYVVNPDGAKIYSGYFTDQVVKTLPYGTKLKVHRQDGTRAAVDGVAGEPADADWAIDPKDVRRSL